MVVLGIDPGSRRMGYGIIEQHGSTCTLIDAGILPITASDDPTALLEAQRAYRGILEQYKPDVVGIERLFFLKNRTTGIAVSQARGIILAATAAEQIPIHEMTPNEVKLGLTGNGHADKHAVGKMVRLLLNKPELRLIDDALDALAIAMVTAQTMQLQRKQQAS